MKEIIDMEQNASFIKEKIQQLGFMPEHNFEYFRLLTDEGVPLVVYNDKSCILCFTSIEGLKRVVRSLVEPMTKENSLEVLKGFIRYFLDEKGFDEVVVETRHELRLELEQSLKATAFQVKKERYHLTWPIFVMKNFDETLSGGKWKKLRYFKNKMLKENKVVIADYDESCKQEVKDLILGWKKQRTATDRLYHKRYLNFVDSGFKGFDMVKVIRINGRIASLFGGWKIVNSKDYYSSVGIYDYDIPNLGEVSNILDLTFIKELGAEKADFGGGEKALTEFKMKFHPDEFYRTDVYAVVKKKN